MLDAVLLLAKNTGWTLTEIRSLPLHDFWHYVKRLIPQED